MQKRLLMIPVMLLILTAGCRKLAGLGLQEDASHTSYTLDPHIKMNAWQYLKSRSGTDPGNPNDTVFKFMYQAVLYSGIDTNEYTKTDRTFIFLHNNAVLNYNATIPPTVTNTCYWGYYQVSTPLRPAASWSDYSPEQVKSWLQYLIVQGVYSYDNLTTLQITVNTLLPPATDTLNPESIMTLERVKDGSAKIRINGFVGSFSSTDVRTGGILSTNGPIHVVDLYVLYKPQ